MYGSVSISATLYVFLSAVITYGARLQDDISATVHFYGVDAMRGSPPSSVTPADIRDLIGDLLGVRAYTPEGQSFVDSLRSSKSRYRSIVIFLTHDPVSLKHSESSHVSASLNTECRSTACLGEGLLSRAHTRYPMSSVSFNSHVELVLLGPTDQPAFVEQVYLPSLIAAGVSHVKLEGFGEASGSMDLKTGAVESIGLPMQLRDLLSYTNEGGNTVKLSLLKDAPPHLPKELSISSSHQCLKSLITELSLTAASLTNCVAAQAPPYVCVIDPAVARTCFQADPVLKEYLPFVSHIFAALAQQYSFRLAGSQNRHFALLIEGSYDVSGSPSWDSHSVKLSLNYRPTEKGVGTDYTEFFSYSEDDFVRQLAIEPSVSTPAPPKKTEDQSDATLIQITFWSSIAVVAATYVAVYSIHAMSNERDPMIYTKVATS